MARRRRGAGSESAGYHYDATPKGPSRPSRTPVKAPPKGMAAKGPAGDYAGADQDFAAAVASLPAPARKATEAAAARASAQTTRATTRRRRARRAATREQRQRSSAALASVAANRRRRQSEPTGLVAQVADRLAEAARAATEAPAAATRAIDNAAVAAYRLPKSKTTEAFGHPTLGTPRVAEVVKAARQGGISHMGKGQSDPSLALISSRSKKPKAGLQVDGKGQISTPRARKAQRRLGKLEGRRAALAPSLDGLSPEEAEVVKYARKAHRKYPEVPTSLLMSLTRQESGFNAAAVSSAAAQGLTQFIPSTASSYGVQYGTGKREKQTQLTGAAHLLTDSGFASDPKGALTSYTGGYSDAEYNNPVLEGAGDYTALDKASKVPPKLARKLKAARAEAAAVGLKRGQKQGAAAAGPLPAKKHKGEWAGTKDILLKTVRGIPISSTKRTPAENASVGGSSTSDHLTTNTTTYATDLPASGAALNQIGSKVAGRLGVEGWSPGNYDWYTTPKYPGYRFQILSEVEGHFDHVHVGSEWTGEALPAGTIAGGSSGSTTTFTPSGGGSTGSVPTPPVEVGIGKARRRRGAKKGKRKLTPLEEFSRNKRELARLGVPLGGKPKEPDTHPVLQELIEKYGSANPVPTAAAERKAKAAAAAAA